MTGPVEGRISLLAAQTFLFKSIRIYCCCWLHPLCEGHGSGMSRIHMSEGVNLSIVLSFMHITTGAVLQRGINR